MHKEPKCTIDRIAFGENIRDFGMEAKFGNVKIVEERCKADQGVCITNWNLLGLTSK